MPTRVRLATPRAEELAYGLCPFEGFVIAPFADNETVSNFGVSLHA
jgi:hypothetical protein